MKRVLVPLILAGAFTVGQTAAATEPQALPCSGRATHGVWAVAYSGWALIPQPGSPVPQAVPGTISGLMTIGSDGTVGGHQTMVVAGAVTEYRILSGTLEINPDCSGTLRTTFEDVATGLVGEGVEKVILLRGQQEISAMILGVSPGPVGAMGLGTWRRLPPSWR